MHSASPAYGRDYKTASAVLSDWNANKDFVHNCAGICGYGGMYLNKQDVDVPIKIRYDNNRKVLVTK